MITPWTFYMKEKQQIPCIPSKQVIQQENKRKKKKKKDQSNLKQHLQSISVQKSFKTIQQENQKQQNPQVNIQVDARSNKKQDQYARKFAKYKKNKQNERHSPQTVNNSQKKIIKLLQKSSDKFVSYNGYSNYISVNLGTSDELDLSTQKKQSPQQLNFIGESKIYEDKKKLFKKLDILTILYTIKEELKMQKYQQMVQKINAEETEGIQMHQNNVIEMLQNKIHQNFGLRRKNIDISVHQTKNINKDSKQIDDTLPVIINPYKSISFSQKNKYIEKQLKNKHRLNLLQSGKKSNKNQLKSISKSNLFELIQKISLKQQKKKRNQSRNNLQQKSKFLQQKKYITEAIAKQQKEQLYNNSLLFNDKNLKISEGKNKNYEKQYFSARVIKQQNLQNKDFEKNNNNYFEYIQKKLKAKDQVQQKIKLLKVSNKSKLNIINQMNSQSSQKIKYQSQQIKNNKKQIDRMDKIHSNFINNKDKWKLNIYLQHQKRNIN